MEILKDQSILIVEDNDDDFESAFEALTNSENFLNPVFRCENGRDALNYLFNREPFEDVSLYPAPALILLDLNLPGIDGRAVLKEIKRDEILKKIPVIVFTTSSARSDIEACYAMGANSYIQKPVSLERLMQSVQMMQEYWFKISILPKDQ